MQVAGADLAVELDARWRVGLQYAVGEGQLPDAIARTGMRHKGVAVALVDGEAVRVRGGIHRRERRLARGAVAADGVDRDLARGVIGGDKVAAHVVGGHIGRVF